MEVFLCFMNLISRMFKFVIQRVFLNVNGLTRCESYLFLFFAFLIGVATFCSSYETGKYVTDAAYHFIILN